MLNLEQQLKRQHFFCLKFVFHFVKLYHCCLLAFDVVKMTCTWNAAGHYRMLATKLQGFATFRRFLSTQSLKFGRLRLRQPAVFWICTEDKQSCWVWCLQSSALVDLTDSIMVVPWTVLYLVEPLVPLISPFLHSSKDKGGLSTLLLGANISRFKFKLS